MNKLNKMPINKLDKFYFFKLSAKFPEKNYKFFSCKKR